MKTLGEKHYVRAMLNFEVTGNRKHSVVAYFKVISYQWHPILPQTYEFRAHHQALFLQESFQYFPPVCTLCLSNFMVTSGFHDQTFVGVCMSHRIQRIECSAHFFDFIALTIIWCAVQIMMFLLLSQSPSFSFKYCPQNFIRKHIQGETLKQMTGIIRGNPPNMGRVF